MADPSSTKGVFDNDPYGPIKPDRKTADYLSAGEVNKLHARSDVNSSTVAQHHTLGIGHTQAAPGDHSHDAKGSRKVGSGMGLTVTGAKGGNAALTSLLAMLSQVVEFTDTTT